MIQAGDNIKRGAYLGSITPNFPTKKWLLHQWLRLCLVCIISVSIGIVALIIPNWDQVNNIYLWCGLFVVLIYTFIFSYPVFFHSLARIDFFQEEIWVFSKLLFFNIYGVNKMPRKNVRSNLKSSSLLNIVNVFDPVGRCHGVDLCQKDGWTNESLSRINTLIRDGYPENSESTFEHLSGPYIGAIEPECSKNKVLAFLYSSFPRLIMLFLICCIFWLTTSWRLALWITVNTWCLYDIFLVKVKRIEVYDGELMFLGKQSFPGTDVGYVVSPYKIKVTDTYDLFHSRMIRIKEEESFFPIYLSKRNGWSDEQLDELKDVIAKEQNNGRNNNPRS